MKKFSASLFVLVPAVLLVGCSSITRGTPHAPLFVQANLQRADYEVLGTTEGTSKRTRYFFGLVSIIDDDKYSILGIKFFHDEYAFQEKGGFFSGLFVGIEDRAYYKALSKTPDADAVATKSYVETSTGFFPIWDNKEITFQGKAIKYKVHD